MRAQIGAVALPLIVARKVTTDGLATVTAVVALESWAGTESLGIRRHSIKSPPLISKDAPVMYPAASEATKQIRSATSSAVPSLAIG